MMGNGRAGHLHQCGDIDDTLFCMAQKPKDAQSCGIAELLEQLRNRFKSLCLAQTQHTYFLKAKASKLTNAALARLQSCTAELYKETMTFAKESGSFFPSGLVKHFELQSCLASIAALHFEGQALAANEESNAGILYRYGDILENAMKETRSLMNSFQLEESDRVSAEATPGPTLPPRVCTISCMP